MPWRATQYLSSAFGVGAGRLGDGRVVGKDVDTQSHEGKEGDRPADADADADADAEGSDTNRCRISGSRTTKSATSKFVKRTRIQFQWRNQKTMKSSKQQERQDFGGRANCRDSPLFTGLRPGLDGRSSNARDRNTQTTAKAIPGQPDQTKTAMAISFKDAGLGLDTTVLKPN